MLLPNEFRFSVRRLLKNPGFTIYVLLTLILGFGASTAIYSLIQNTVVRAVSFEDPGELVHLWETLREKGINSYEVAPATFLDWQAQNDVFEGIDAYRSTTFNLSAQVGEPERVLGIRATTGIFSMLGEEPIIGRGFQETDGLLGAEPVVVLSHGFWENRFGGDPSWVGKSISLEGEPHTIIGVLPPGFQFARGGWAHVWKPLIFTPQEAISRTSHWLYVVARLRDGVTINQARTQMATLASRLEQQFPDTNEGFGVRVIPLAEEVSGTYRQSFLALFITVFFLLLLACVNLSTLQLARSLDRQKPIAIQAAVGASRWSIVRQLVLENLILGLIGLVPAIFLARWGAKFVMTLIPHETLGFIPGRGEIAFDVQAIGFMLILMLVVVLTFGLMPALQVSRPNLVTMLKDGSGRGGWGARGSKLRTSLAVAQIALTALLLVCSGLLFRSYLKLLEVQPGFNPSGVLSVEVELPDATYPRPQNVLSFQRVVLDQLQGRAGIESAAVIDILPFSGKDASTSFSVPGSSTRDPLDDLSCVHRSITPDYFQTMGIELISGRPFTAEDNPDSRPTVIINKGAAGFLWPNENAVGKHLVIDTDEEEIVQREIVGVVDDVKVSSLGENLRIQVYLPFTQVPTSDMAWVLRTSNDSQSATSALREAIRSIDPNLSISPALMMDKRVSDSLLLQQLMTQILFGFAFFALLLGSTGIYSIMAYSTHQRFREVGLRMALGAHQKDVRWMILRRGLKLMAIGGLVGLVLATAVGFLISGLLYGVTPFDPLVFVGVLITLALIALGASYFPARWAAQVDPVVVMRYE